MSYSIGKDFKFFSLLGFALPSMIMMVFTSLYTIIDGIFISRFVGSDALSAANIIYPVLSIIIGVGIMLGSGGSAVVAKRMGQGHIQSARSGFTMIVLCGVIFSTIVLIAGNIWITPIVKMLGATPRLITDCRIYLGILLLFSPLYTLQLLFQTFFVTAGKPGIGLGITVFGGVANAVLDYWLMGPCNMGIAGAAIATGTGQMIPAVFGLFYFSISRESLYFTKPEMDWKLLMNSCFNGSSEMVSNLSAAVVTFLFNIIMLKMQGEEGVAAITIALYGQFLFNSLYLGYSMGVAPVTSYNYGKKNEKLLKRVTRINIWFICVSAVFITTLSVMCNDFVVLVFSPRGSKTFEIASAGCLLFALNYLFSGINIYSSSMFTALSDGKTSAIISFLRTFIILVLSILFLPVLIGEKGVWLSVPVAEALTSIIVVIYIIRYKKVYRY